MVVGGTRDSDLATFLVPLEVASQPVPIQVHLNESVRGCEGGQCEQRQQRKVLPPERERQSLPLNHRG